MTRQMTRKEFQGVVHEITDQQYTKKYGKKAKKEDRKILEIEWITGGMTGGNCWGDDSDEPVYSDPEPEFNDLDNILLELVPNMGFLHYKKLIQLIENDERREYEYYGNSNVYSIKRIKVDDIWKFLCDYKFIEEVKKNGKK